MYSRTFKPKGQAGRPQGSKSDLGFIHTINCLHIGKTATSPTGLGRVTNISGGNRQKRQYMVSESKLYKPGIYSYKALMTQFISYIILRGEIYPGLIAD